jgi:hypothetical protein
MFVFCLFFYLPLFLTSFCPLIYNSYLYEEICISKILFKFVICVLTLFMVFFFPIRVLNFETNSVGQTFLLWFYGLWCP